LVGVMIMNEHCYIRSPFAAEGGEEEEMIVRRTVEIKKQVLEDMFGWNLMVVDEGDYKASGTSYEERKKYIMKLI